MNESSLLCRMTNHEPMNPENFNIIAQIYCFNYLKYVFHTFVPNAYNLSIPIDEIQLRTQLNNELIFNKWKQCSDAARSCCSNVLSKSFKDELHCDAVWDGWSCHSPTKAGQISQTKCSDYIVENKCNIILGHSALTCTENATWFKLEGNEWTNYTKCFEPTLLLKHQTINLNILSNLVSLIFLIFGLLVFFAYR